MEARCSYDQSHPATCCCICTFPMSPLCEAHTSLHTSGVHFTLPLTALSVPMTKEGYLRTKHRLYQTCCNYNSLLDKIKEIDFCEQSVETVCSAIVQSVLDTQDQWKKRFSGVKRDCLEKMNKALEEIRLHALEQGWNAPQNSLSQLLWCTEPRLVADSNILEFQAECNRAQFSKLLHVQLRFITSDLGQLGTSKDSPSFILKDYSQSSHIEDLKRKLEAANQENQELRRLATVIYEKARDQERDLETLRADSERMQLICGRAKEENDALHEQLKEMQNLLALSRARESTLEDQCAALWLSTQKEEVASDTYEQDEGDYSEAEYRPMQIDSPGNDSEPIAARVRSSGSGETDVGSVDDSQEDDHDSECYVCGGTLILCDSCRHVAHLQCVNLFVCFRQTLPEEDWFCDDCRRTPIRPPHPVTRRYRRLRKRNFNYAGEDQRT